MELQLLPHDLATHYTFFSCKKVDRCRSSSSPVLHLYFFGFRRFVTAVTVRTHDVHVAGSYMPSSWLMDWMLHCQLV
ncbi:hypothetical protein Nepgr_007533 [Nepenthes gracilis]|uniref:Uncharacterized protein n=1 Tax=Nepenthes gracilis TaxID=150966 RepID=A0AAD3S774_NEPGR|nr:hypothetical protein Nepgr_007533 [Nepenthes gracilis]